MNKKNRMFIILLVFCLLLLPITFSYVNVSIDSKDEYIEGEEIIFEYIIETDQQSLPFHYIIVNCPNAPVPLLNPRETNLRVNQKNSLYEYNDSFTFITVDEPLMPQKCSVGMAFINSDKIETSSDFEIRTKTPIDLNVKICGDEQCTDSRNYFEKGDTIFIDYSSSVIEPNLQVSLILPNNKVRSLSLPFRIIASETGEHKLIVTASKQGYKTIHKTEQFGVIEKETPIKDASLCNGNNICDKKETPQNCPQDCLLTESKEPQKPRESNPYLILYLGIAIVFIILAINIFRLKHKK